MRLQKQWMWVLLVLLIVAAGVVPSMVWGQGTSRVVHRVKSEYQEITVIDTPNGFRQMLFDAKMDGRDAIQSEMKKSMPNELTLAYSRHMMTALPLVARPQKNEKVLVIGLGGACMQRFLYELLPQSTIESAELDPAVLEVAKGFFGLVLDERQKVSVGDGRKFIESAQEKYDLILLDAFSATSIPYALATREFLEMCKGRLREGGVVCANLWSSLPEYNDMLKTYEAVFPEWHLLRCGGGSSNVILLAFNEKRGLTREKWAQMGKEYEKSHGVGLPLGRMIEDGWMEPRPGTGKVLLDKVAPNK
jgi:spermidine synthase